MILESLFLLSLFLLVYTYVIYPLMAVLIGSGPDNVEGALALPISFLVPAHNEASVVAAKIRNFHSLDYPAELAELLIADDGSDDATADVVRQHQCARVRLLASTERAGKAATMNRLAAAAKHPLLLFSDANVMLASNAARRMAAHMGDDRVGAVTGEVRLVGSDREFRAGESLYYWLERRIQNAESRIGSVMGVDGGMYLLRRDLFRPLPADTILDDFLVSINTMRSRRRVIYDSSAKATESGTPTVRQEFSRRIRIAAGAVQLIKRGNVPRFDQLILWGQFLSHKLLRWLSPVLLLVLLFSNLAVLDLGPAYQIVFATQLLLYALIFAAWLFRGYRRTPLGSVLFYFGLSQCAMMVGLGKGILNRQPPQWEKGSRAESKGAGPEK